MRVTPLSEEHAKLRSMEAARPVRLSERLRLGWRNGRSARGGELQLQDLVVITGYSGAGKSTALHLFEDAGYFCVDNLPPEMIRHLAELFMHPGSQVERSAVVSDVRGGDYFDGLVAVLDGLDRAGVAHRVLFLDADEQSLLTRFKETRRRHPMTPAGSVADGIAAEHALLEPLKERADLVVDTTGLKASELRRRIADEMLPTSTPGKLAVTFMSFGHKHGPPRDADLAFDVRFLPNPHYEARLRPLTGLDARIVAYVDRDGELQAFYDHLVPLLDYLLPQYVAEGKSHLTVAIGCTGGRHRSVVIAEHLAGLFRERGEYLVEVAHRDVEKRPRG
jgi:RNase adapter protein RapZ